MSAGKPQPSSSREPPPAPEEEPEDPLRKAAAELGRRGGLKGGKERRSFPPEEWTEIARKAAARWKKPD